MVFKGLRRGEVEPAMRTMVVVVADVSAEQAIEVPASDDERLIEELAETGQLPPGATGGD